MSLLAKTDKDFDETGGGKKRNYARGSTPFEFNENMTRHNNTFVNGALLSSGNPVGYCQFAGPTDVDRQINFEKNCLISYGSCSYGPYRAWTQLDCGGVVAFSGCCWITISRTRSAPTELMTSKLNAATVGTCLWRQLYDPSYFIDC